MMDAPERIARVEQLRVHHHEGERGLLDALQQLKARGRFDAEQAEVARLSEAGQPVREGHHAVFRDLDRAQLVAADADQALDRDRIGIELVVATLVLLLHLAPRYLHPVADLLDEVGIVRELMPSNDVGL